MLWNKSKMKNFRITCNLVTLTQTVKDSEGIIPNESEDYRPPAELYPYLTNVAEIYEGEKPPQKVLTPRLSHVHSHLLSLSRSQVGLPPWPHPACRLRPFPSEPLHGAPVCAPSTADTAAPPWRRTSGPSPGPTPHTPARVPTGTHILTWTLSFWTGIHLKSLPNRLLV